MRRIVLGMICALGFVPTLSARAETAECADLRDKIVKMEQNSARPPGWFNLDTYMRLLYKADCVQNPTVQRDPEFWYDIHGNLTGVPAGSGRPDNGAYTTTLAIGQKCAGEDPGNPSMCALLMRVAEACRNPRDEEQRRTCVMTVGKAETGTVQRPPGSPELPPMQVGLDGGPFNLNPACMGVLSQFGDDLALDDSQAARRSQWLATLQSNCPDFLDALKRRTGADPIRTPAAFWPAFGQLLMSGFAPPGMATPSIGNIASDPGKIEMCRQADKNMNTCKQRLDNMRSVGTDPTGGVGQAGAFNQCYILYGQVVAMCQSTDRAAARMASRAPPPAPAKAAPAPPSQAGPPAGGQSRPPPPAPQQRPQMSDQCQKLVGAYVDAAQANDGVRALAGYNALKKAGGCNVLDKVDQAGPAPAPGGFPVRGATPNIDRDIGTCDRAVDGCAEAMRELEASTSPAAKAALIGNAIRVGLEVGAAVANGMAAAGAQGRGGGGGGGGGGSNMNSIGNRPVRSTYGQGAPVGPPQRNAPSDITGTK